MSHNGFATVREMKHSLLHNSDVTKQWTTKYLHITRYFSKLYKIMVNIVIFVDLGEDRRSYPPLDPPLSYSTTVLKLE